MKKEDKFLDLAPMWHKGEGKYTSAIIQADRLSDLFQMSQESEIRIFVKPLQKKYGPKSPDARLVAFRV